MDYTSTALVGQIERATGADAPAEQINRRYAGTQHRVSWNGQDLECEVNRHARRTVSAAELRSAVDALIAATCVREPSAVDERCDVVTFRWNRVGKLTYPWEWPAEGWKAAAKLGLQALQVLRPLGLTFRAPQPGDLFMVGSQPTLANLGAIMPWSPGIETQTREQLERQFIRPVELAALGRAGLARRLLRADATGLSTDDRDALLGPGGSARPTDLALDDWLASTTFPQQSARGESWGSYEARMTRGRSEEIAAKSGAVLSVIDRLRPATVLDMGCNLGLFSQLAANEGALVVGVDSDEDCLNLFFTRASEWASPATAVQMDLSDPSPLRGWGRGWNTPAANRLSSDLVIALALIHHLAQGARIRADELHACFSALARHWLLLEFVPLGPTNPFTWGADFYSLDWLLDTLGPTFVLRQSWQHGERDRVVILLERSDDTFLRH